MDPGGGFDHGGGSLAAHLHVPASEDVPEMGEDASRLGSSVHWKMDEGEQRPDLSSKSKIYRRDFFRERTTVIVGAVTTIIITIRCRRTRNQAR